ncbi:MAG: helix-turn-helix domain-containing protein [Chromatiales bacterium]|nr:helix-turn-helix domain-containing protein [Chromatiales bacterium]
MRKSIYTRQSRIVGEWIREIRERAGVAQRELCRRLGQEHSFISKCELGERRIDIVEFYWICEACGANPETEARKLVQAFADVNKE